LSRFAKSQRIPEERTRQNTGRTSVGLRIDVCPCRFSCCGVSALRSESPPRSSARLVTSPVSHEVEINVCRRRAVDRPEQQPSTNIRNGQMTYRLRSRAAIFGTQLDKARSPWHCGTGLLALTWAPGTSDHHQLLYLFARVLATLLSSLLRTSLISPLLWLTELLGPWDLL